MINSANMAPTIRILAIGCCLWVCACESKSTSPTTASHSGEWSGTTSQGAAIAFTVSPDERVTSITLGYNFNGCSGIQTYSRLNLETAPNVTCIPGPCDAAIASYRAFGYASDRTQGAVTTVNGLFLSQSTAQGSSAFQDYPGCGSATGVTWAAAKR